MFANNSPLQIWLVAFFTLALFSVAYKDNPIYRFVENLYVGLSVAYNLAVPWFNYGRPTVLNIAKGQYALIIPVIIGLLIYCRYFKSIAWLARYSITFTLGIGSGYILTRDFRPNFVQQIVATFRPLFSGVPLAQSLNNLVLVVGVLGTMSYFLFTQKRTGIVRWGATIGKWTMMIAFGSAFGNTVAGRISLFLGRMQFLLGDWLKIMAQ